MLDFSPKLPVSDQERLWVDEGFRRLDTMLGKSRMLEAKVILPTDDYFPDPYDKTPAAVEKLFHRICSYMRVDRGRIELEIFRDETEELREVLPYWSGGSSGCAGFYQHRTGAEGDEGQRDEERMLVALRSTLLKDPPVLIATIAHELGHVILLGGRLMDTRVPDHEPMTDLLTVFLGLGIFGANSVARFRQFQDATRQSWSMERLGYLSEEVYGYALARFAIERGESKSEWAKHLSTNVRAFFKRSRVWLEKNSD